uniref:Transformer major male splice variant M1 n=1 Tax=Lucilia cuprina TaxID=7375 RepID=C5HJY9_LUCCU|nr:transformer major male splice variant M1 [Lucilia cuprina]ACS34693.1 transformer major male splice variant M1 [Lucilia cuprina]
MDSITTGLAASSILEGTKFKIQQSIPSGSIKRGPHAIVRTADLNDGINIQRRFGNFPFKTKPNCSRFLLLFHLVFL